jgi:catechol 1,2-dioxygenase
MDSNVSRRRLLSGAVVGSASLLVNGCAPGEEIAHDDGAEHEGFADFRSALAGLVTPSCVETEDNLLGPFYLANAPFRTSIAAANEGQRLVVSGTVAGAGPSGCVPLANALVDVWQANARGRYDLSRTFKWRGRMNADASGAFSFETILPGRYLNGDQYRPRHIHFIVSSPGYATLTTQLYFAGDPFIADDPFVKTSLVTPLTRQAGVLHGSFPIVLAQAATPSTP